MEEERKSAAISPTPTTTAAAAAAATARKERVYRGVRMRKWGKWVAEIREPNKRSRIWLGSYSTPVAAARAYDTAVYLLRGRSARLNFPDELSAQPSDVAECQLTAASIRKKATEVGARIDAMQMGLLTSSKAQAQAQAQEQHQTAAVRRPKNPDLNQCPSPDSSDAED